MRILYTVYSPRIGGGEVVCLRTLSAAREHGHQAILVVPAAGPVQEQAEREGVPVYILPLRRSFQTKQVISLARLLKQERINLVHTHDALPGVVLARCAAMLTRIPIVNHVHTTTTYNRKAILRIAQQAADSLTARYAAAIVSVSEDTRNRLIAQGVPASKVITIPNGTELSVPLAPERISALRRQWGSKPTTQIIGCVGRLAPAKGQHDLLAAAQMINRSVQDVHLVIMGEDAGIGQPYENELRRQAQQSDIADSVVFAGFQSDASLLMNGLDIVVLPSYQEAMPLTILEAMAAGKPVVATNVNGIPEVVVDGVTGILIPPGDPQALADALLRLLRNPDLAANMGLAGRKRVEKLFNLDLLHKRLFELYDEAVKR